jgi:hypothetical protein
MELHNADPAGSSAHSRRIRSFLSDVIAFRDEHAKSLQKLHFAIDKIFASFPSEGDVDLAADDFMNHVEDVIARFDASSIPFFKPTVSVNNIVSAASGAIAEAFASFFGASPDVAKAIGVVAQGLKFVGRKSSLARPGNRYPADFEYVYDVLASRMPEANGGLPPPSGGVQPTIICDSIFSSQEAPPDWVDGWTGGGAFMQNSVISTNLHHPAELAEFFEAWEQHKVVDDDEHLDTPRL